MPVFLVTAPNLEVFNDISALLDGTNAAAVAISDDSNDIISSIQTAYEVERGRGGSDLIIITIFYRELSLTWHYHLRHNLM